MTWKRIVSLEFVAIFLEKVNNNTPVHIVGVLAEDLSFCMDVMGGQQIIKHTRLKHILATHKRARRERERERNKTLANQVILGSVGIIIIYIQVEYFSKITTCYMFSRNPMDSLQNAGVPILKSPPWDPVISLQTAWPWKFPFSK